MDGGGEDAAALHWHAAGDPGQEHEAAWRFGLSGIAPGSPPGAAAAEERMRCSGLPRGS